MRVSQIFLLVTPFRSEAERIRISRAKPRLDPRVERARGGSSEGLLYWEYVGTTRPGERWMSPPGRAEASPDCGDDVSPAFALPSEALREGEWRCVLRPSRHPDRRWGGTKPSVRIGARQREQGNGGRGRATRTTIGTFRNHCTRSSFRRALPWRKP